MKENICGKCNGTGWVKKGEQEFVEKCDCIKTNILLTKTEKANIPPKFLDRKLEWAFQPDTANPSQTTAKKTAQKFIDDYPAIKKGLLFQGKAGRGKTTLLCAIGYELIEKKNVSIYYIDQNTLVREMRSGEHMISRDFSSINRLIEKLANVELLLFDELGTTGLDKLTPWIYENIYYIFNSRYNNNKLTICATNYFDVKDTTDSTGVTQNTLEERVGKLIRSRLYEMTDIIQVGGSDFREKNLKGIPKTIR
ncbi:MAG TPA: ATP-binding protein [Candidatus Kapabacteria bacterium]|nr:ATP-binding protein [Candidatus Kapabacteria bacterium]